MEVIKLSDTRTRYTINKNNKKAFELFNAKRYKEAFRLFAHTLTLESENQEAKIGALLSDMAQDMEEQAVGLHDLYQILLTQTIGKRTAQKQILEMIKSMDSSTSKICDMLKNIEDMKAESINGIMYKDFKLLASEKATFKEAFEDLMYSTKIIFTSKSEFYEFLNQLVDNNYQELSMDYIEGLKKNIIYDGELEQILQKVLLNQSVKE